MRRTLVRILFYPPKPSQGSECAVPFITQFFATGSGYTREKLCGGSLMESNQQHQELLQKYAEAIVRVGLNLRAGQRLIITNATARGVPPAGRALVHAVTKAAYAAGARYVEVIWGDEEMLRIRSEENTSDLQSPC